MIERNRQQRRLLAALTVVLAGLPITVWSADGTWIDTSTPGAILWSNPASWTGGTVASGAGATANFNTINPTGDINITLDTPRTIGTLIFGDTNPASAAGWNLNGTSTLTLDNTGGTGSPAITVNALGTGKSATINVPLAGTAGFTKSGAGTLTIGAAYASSFAGATIVDGGTLTFAADNANVKGLQLGTVTSGAGSTNLGTLNINANVTATGLVTQTNSANANTINIAAGKTLTINAGITVGYDPGSAGAASTSRLNVTGGSFSAGGTGAILIVGANSTSGANSDTGILDLSGLGSFTFTGGEARVAGGIANNTSNRANGVLTLSGGSSIITVTNFTVGGGTGGTVGSINPQGTLNLGAGANIINSDNFFVGTWKNNGLVQFAGSTGTLQIRGTAGGTSRSAIVIGQNLVGQTSTSNSPSGTVNLNGHSVDILASTLTIGNRTQTTTGGATGVFSFDNGTVDVSTLRIATRDTSNTIGTVAGTMNVGGSSSSLATLKVGMGGFTIANNNIAGGAANGTLNINVGGTVQTSSDILPGAAVGTQNPVINLQGGTLDLLDADHVTHHNISSATLTAITINANSGTLKDAGTINGTGGVTKGGTTANSLLTIAGTNSYTGDTTVNVGTVSVTGSTLNTGTVTVNGSSSTLTATLSGPGSVGAVSLTSNFSNLRPGATSADGQIGTLTMASLSNNGGDMRFDLASPGGTNDKVIVTGAANFSGATISIAGAPTAGSYTLMTAGSVTGSVPTVNAPPGTRSTYNDSFVGNSLVLNVVGSAKSLTWTGAAAVNGDTWDLNTTQNWSDNGGTTTNEKFFNQDSVTFGNGPTNRTINIVTSVSPTAVTVNNNASNPYTFSGNSDIAGANTTLTKSGAGSLTITNNNTYGGITTINGGTIQLGNGGTTGSLGPGDIVNNGVLAFNRSDAVSVASFISGSGQVQQLGAGTSNLTLSATNSYTGATTINSGSLTVTNSGSLGATTGPTIGSVTVASGGTLDLSGDTTANDLNFGGKQFTIAGTGAGTGSGAIRNTGTVAQQNALQKVALSADATVNVGQRFDIRANQAGGANVASLDLAGFTLTKVGGNTFGLVNTTVTSGNILTTAGTLDIEQGSVVQGTGTLTYDSTAGAVTAQFSQTAAGNITRPIAIIGNGVQLGSASNNATTVNSNISLQGDLTVTALNGNGTGTVTLAGNITESGGPHSITKTNNGTGVSTLVLSGNNAFTGGLKIVGGVVQAGSTTALNASIPVSFDDTAPTTTGLRLAGNSVTVGGLSANSNPFVENASATPATLTVNTSAPATFAGILQDGAGGGALSLAMGSGNLTLNAANTYTGTTSVTGGGTLNIANSVVSNTFNVQNGTLFVGNAPGFPLNSNVTLGNGANSGVLDLNGGILTVTSLSTSGTGAGNNVINSSASQAVLNFAGANSTFGGKIQGNTLLNVGDGQVGSSLTLAGANTFTGGANVNNLSTLNVTGSLAATGTVNVKSGGILTGSGNAGNINLQFGSIIRPGATLGTISAASFSAIGSDYQVDLAASNASDKIAVSGAANFGGASTVTLSSTTPPAGTFTLLTASSLSGTSPTLNVPTGTRQTFALHFGDTVPNAMTLNITGSNKSLTWTGAGGSTWDLNTTQSWSDNGGTSTNEKFFQFDGVTFGNGPANRNVTLNFSAFPAAMTVNNSSGNDYTISGTGGIVGSGSLTKTGTGTLTLNTANAYSGGTIINGGVLQIGSGGTAGTLGIGPVSGTGGTLAFNRSDSVTVNASIGGSVSVSQSGGGGLILGGTNTYGGSTTINSGSIKLNPGATLPTGTSVTLGDAANHSGTLDLGGQNATVGGLVTVGTGASNSVMNTGVTDSTLTYAGGTSTFSGSIQDVGNPKINLTVASGTLILTGTGAYSGLTTTNAGGTLKFGSGGTTGTVPAGNIITNGNVIISHSDAVTIPNIIGGAGGIQQAGTGTTTISGTTNTYTGPTTVSNGILVVTNSNSLGSTAPAGNVTITSGGTLDFGGNVPIPPATTGNLNLGATRQWFIAGSGFGDLGAIANTNAATDQSTNGNLVLVTLTADATVNATGRFDIRGGSPFLDLQGHTLTKTGGAQFSFFTGTITPGTIDVQAGTFSIQQGATADGNGLVILENNTRMAFNNASVAFVRPIKGNGAVTIFNSATSSTIASPISLNGSLTFAGSNASTVLTLQGNITETTPSSVIVNNTNTPTPTVVLSGNSSYTGATILNCGILQVNGALGSRSLNLGGGTLIMANGNSGANFTAGGTTVAAGGSALNASAVTGGSVALGAINRSVGGTVDFTLPTTGSITTTSSNTNSILGGWATVGGVDWARNNAGAVAILTTYTNDAWAAGNNTTATLANSSPAANSTTNSLRFNAAAGDTVALSGTNVITSGGILVTANVGTNISTISGGTLEGAAGLDLIINQFNTAGQLTIGSTIADNTTATALTKSGGGTLLLNNANTFTGGTRINAGTVMLGNDAALGGPTAALTLAVGGTLDLNGHNLSVGPLASNGGTITSSVGSASTLTVGDASSPTFDGVIQNGSGTVALVKTGTGTLTLGGANTYTGGTTVAQGFLQGGTGGLQGNISITSPTAGVIFNGGGTYAGIVSGTGGVSKIGGGALIFSNANGSQTYSGPTTLGGGTLTVGTANGLNSASSLVFSGGALATGGLNQSFGTIGLLASSTVDLGAAAVTTPVSFADSHSVPWTAGATLRFANWTGSAAGGGTDEVMVGASGLSAAQLSAVKFNNFKTGAKILTSGANAGEVVPLSTTPLVTGDIDQNGLVNGSDIQAMLTALTDLNAYKTSKGLSDFDLVDVADLNRNGAVSNSDLQSLIGLLISQSGGGSGGGAAAVPEPASLTLCVGGAIGMLGLLRRRRVFVNRCIR